MAAKAKQKARAERTAPLIPPALDELMTKEQVAAALKVSPRTLSSLIAAGEFPGPDFPIGRSGRYRVSTVDAWCAARTAEHRAGA